MASPIDVKATMHSTQQNLSPERSQALPSRRGKLWYADGEPSSAVKALYGAQQQEQSAEVTEAAVRAAAVRCGLPQSVADGDWCATLEQLVGELQARRMLRYAAALRTAGGGSGESDDAAPSEVNAVAAEALRRVCAAAGVESPAAADSSGAEKALRAAAEAASGVMATAVQHSAMRRVVERGSLSAEQLELLSEVHAALASEYRVRREMVIKRADVTLQSFLWSDRLKETAAAADVAADVRAGQAALAAEPSVALDDVFEARAADLDVAAGKTSANQSAAHRQATALLRHQ